MADIIAFTAEQVSCITGLSIRQLYYWDRHPQFFTPEYADQDRGRYFGRIYSFRDVVSLRTIAILRNEYGIPLQELRRIDPWLKAQHETPWASLRLYVLGKHVYFQHLESGQIVSARFPHQTVIPIDIGEIINEVRSASNRLRERTPDQVGRIVRHRYVAHNAHVLAGTRIPTSAIWNLHSAGYTADQIIREYPRLTVVDVEAAVEFEQNRQQKRAG